MLWGRCKNHARSSTYVALDGDPPRCFFATRQDTWDSFVPGLCVGFYVFPPNMQLISHANGLIPVLLAALLAGPCALAADVVLDERFDGPTPSWQVRPAAHVRVNDQSRVQIGEASNPLSTERLGIACQPGFAAYAALDVGRLPVLDELDVETMVRSNRAGLQLAAEVVFPRSRDAKTGQPIRALVHGVRYVDAGRWQRLRLDRVPLLATRQARLMNADPNREVDHREAYVEQIVLIVPGGAGESVVEIDRLTIVGVVSEEQAADSGSSPLDGQGSAGPLLQAADGVGAGRTQAIEPVKVHRRGDTLTVAGRPFVPRVLEYRGEPFELVVDLGFNAVWLAEVPTEAQLHAARDSKLWVICPPPPADKLATLTRDSVWQTVLLWSLGLDRDALSLDAITSSVEQLRAADPFQRPLLVGASGQERSFAQLADVLAQPKPMQLLPASRSPAPASLTDTRLPMMGCSPWTQISLGWTSQARQQAQLFAPRASHLGWHDPRQVRRKVLEAMAAGTRGLVVRTPDRLGRAAPEASQLSDQLKLLNSELSLVEPWLVAGKRIDGAQLVNSDRAATAWRLGRSRLVFIPERLTPTDPSKPVVLVMAGVPETVGAHSLSSAGLLPLSGRRVAGGYRLQLTHMDSGGWVVLTDDSRSRAELGRRIGSGGPKAAQVERKLAIAELLQLETIHSQLAGGRGNPTSVRIAALKQGVQQCDQLLASRQHARTLHLASQLRYDTAVQLKRLVQQASDGAGFASVPTQYEVRLLPTHEALERSLASMPRGVNLLAGGDFESLASTRNAGWQHANYAGAKLETQVQFATMAPHHGRACLRLTAHSKVADGTLGGAEERPVVWINSPETPVAEGQVIEISGWARVAAPASSSGAPAGKLLVVDSLGGEELALRIPATTGWRPFRLVRRAAQQDSVQLSLALTGPATVDVDAVMIRSVNSPRQVARDPRQVSNDSPLPRQ